MRAPSIFAAACVTAALAFALGACSGAGGAGDPTLPSSGAGAAGAAGAESEDGAGAGGQDADSASLEDAALAFAQCMRENGVDMEDPAPGEGIRLQVTPETEALVTAAQEICQPIMEQARAGQERDPAQEAENFDKLLQAAKCMRDKGYDFPDPEMDGGRISQKFQNQPGQEPDQERMQADSLECQQAAGFEGPLRGPGAGTGGGTAGGGTAGGGQSYGGTAGGGTADGGTAGGGQADGEGN
jgi:hypothetical protein